MPRLLAQPIEIDISVTAIPRGTAESARAEEIRREMIRAQMLRQLQSVPQYQQAVWPGMGQQLGKQAIPQAIPQLQKQALPQWQQAIPQLQKQAIPQWQQQAFLPQLGPTGLTSPLGAVSPFGMYGK